MDHSHSRGFQNLTKIEGAIEILFDSIGEPRVSGELISIHHALGRFLCNDVVANLYLPARDRSVMDGYAVRSEDVKDASKERPVVLGLIGESRIGEIPRKRIKRTRAISVATGSLIPDGADAIVMVESTAPLPGNRIEVYSPVEKGQNIAKKGEDLEPGRVVLRKGTRLRSQDLGILGAMGFRSVRVARKPRIAILSTGNELVDSKSEATEAKVIDINRLLISSMLVEIGAEPVDLGIAKDQEKEIKASLRKGLKSSDAVLVTAGSSVGKKDLVPECINRLGKPGILVHGIAMRPAMPTALAVVKGKPLLSLPGFPTSAMFAFRVFARPLVARMLGIRELVEPTVKATLHEKITGTLGLRTFVRVRVRKGADGFEAEPLKLQRASALMSMVGANGIVTVPEDAGAIEAGQSVDVTLIGDVLL